MLISKKVYLDLKEKILSGQYLSGVHLVENDLIREYSVSRTTIRDALRRLTEDEIVEQIPNKGIIVRRLTEKEVTDYHLVMKVLEGAAASLLASMHSEEDLKKLEKKLDEDEAAIASDNFFLHSKNILEFRSLLAECTCNEPLIKIIHKIHAVTTLYHLSHPLKTGMSMGNSLDAHRKLLQAIKEHRADLAEEIMKNIIQASLDDHLTFQKALSPDPARE